jgi:hypothetical protein
MTEERKLPTTVEEIKAGLDDGTWTSIGLLEEVKKNPEFKKVIDELMSTEAFSVDAQDRGQKMLKDALKTFALTVTGIEVATGADIDKIQLVASMGPFMFDVRIKTLQDMNEDEHRSFVEKTRDEGGLPSYGLAYKGTEGDVLREQ